MIITFPISAKTNRVARWVVQYDKYYRLDSPSSAEIWLEANVPEQLHEQILEIHDMKMNRS